MFFEDLFFGKRLKKIFEDIFFGEHLRLCPWSLALASRIPVLGLEKVCPRKGETMMKKKIPIQISIKTIKE